ncbi:hypothetical protein M0813_08403 [Anaeramoeba flamelloides]|uniref:Uncharacterized protein n=1 Tax=Anaeramoeba flamelloides TaxID=1746091 RepID=A0ABQ8XA02_9EUKA|nr:hypothetical protein M0813_08403 [Anaeramoeba flamelloides]
MNKKHKLFSTKENVSFLKNAIEEQLLRFQQLIKEEQKQQVLLKEIIFTKYYPTNNINQLIQIKSSLQEQFLHLFDKYSENEIIKDLFLSLSRYLYFSVINAIAPIFMSFKDLGNGHTNNNSSPNKNNNKEQSNNKNNNKELNNFLPLNETIYSKLESVLKLDRDVSTNNLKSFTTFLSQKTTKLKELYQIKTEILKPEKKKNQKNNNLKIIKDLDQEKGNIFNIVEEQTKKVIKYEDTHLETLIFLFELKLTIQSNAEQMQQKLWGQDTELILNVIPLIEKCIEDTQRITTRIQNELRLLTRIKKEEEEENEYLDRIALQLQNEFSSSLFNSKTKEKLTTISLIQMKLDLQIWGRYVSDLYQIIWQLQSFPHLKLKLSKVRKVFFNPENQILIEKDVKVKDKCYVIFPEIVQNEKVVQNKIVWKKK